MSPGPADPFDFPSFATHMASPAPIMGRKKAGKISQEFRDFALKGSVLDMAIGIIMGVAFGKIIASFVEDVTMPIIGWIFGRVDFSNMFFSMTGKHFETLAAARAVGAPTLNYGLFLNAIFNFTIIAVSVFLLVRQVNRMRRMQQQAVELKECPFCFSAISAKAVRCPMCTSQLQAAASGAAGG